MLNLKRLTALMGGLLWTVGLLTPLAQAVKVPESVIRDKVTTHVRERLAPLLSANDQDCLAVKVPKIPAPINFPEAKEISGITIETDSTLGSIYSNRGVVRVQLSSQDGSRKTFGVPVELRIEKPVWVSKTTINAGQPLHASDFELQTRDVSYSYPYAIGQEQPLSQYVARVNLRPGEILDNRKLSIPPDVRYNDEVRILLSSKNGMTLIVPGIAMSDARIGDTIRVRQSRFKKKYYTAKVLDKNRVLVEI